MEKNDIPNGYVRVTEVLGAYSTLSNIDPVTLANAADRGTRVHRYCEMHALNLFLPEIDDDCKNYVKVFKEWFDEMVIQVVYTEKRLNSSFNRLSGGVDLIAILKGDSEPTIVDYKTPLTASKSWQLQTAAYQLLASDVLQIMPKRRICLMLPKYGDKPKIVEYENHLNDQLLFLKALELYRFFN